MTFDKDQAHALRTAINETITRLVPPSIGGGIPGEARQALLNHLDHLLVQERLLFTHAVALSPTGTDAPWYPDDSGEWVEVPDDLRVCPPELNEESLIDVLLRAERDTQNYSGPTVELAGGLYWDFNHSDDNRIVAYKKVKP